MSYIRLTKKNSSLLLLLFLSAAVSVAAIGGIFQLISHIVGNNSTGETSSERFTTKVSVGESMSGEMESESFKTGTGFVSIIATADGEAPASDLESAYVYPSPYKPGSGGSYDSSFITFTNMTAQAEIRVFNVAGELVATLDKDDSQNEYTWTPQNDAGEDLASGVYIFFITNDAGQEKTGKFAIVR